VRVGKIWLFCKPKYWIVGGGLQMCQMCGGFLIYIRFILQQRFDSVWFSSLVANG